MIGLDTNVLVRYLTQDDRTQARKATRVIEGGADQGEMQTVLERILRTAQFRFDHKDQLWQALHDMRQGKGDFSDYLIGRLGDRAGWEETVTFDKALSSSPLLRRL